MKTMKLWVGALLLALWCGWAQADGVDSLKSFVNEVKTGRAQFTQTVTSSDGAKKKNSSGYFEFARPNRFRFVYSKPFEQVIVADGRKVWMHDPDLNQVSSRSLADALGSTPAALLAGTALEKDFDLVAQPAKDGLTWARAVPKVKDSNFQYLNVGFKGPELVALEIVDSFGQRSLMQFSGWTTSVVWPADHFLFAIPAGADVLTQ
jgi:outer membrane lipoprotein carrier protein